MRYGKGRRIALVVAMAGLAAGSACRQTPREPAPTTTDLPSRQTRVPGEYIVTLAAGADVKAVADLYGRFGIRRTQDCVFIQLTLNAGRSLEQKKEFYKAVADGLHERLGVRREDVFINLIEVAKENWSFGNGVAQYAG